MKSLICTLAVGVLATNCYIGTAYADTFISPLEESVPRTHAHNGYENEYSLFDALHNGFISVEPELTCNFLLTKIQNQK